MESTGIESSDVTNYCEAILHLRAAMHKTTTSPALCHIKFTVRFALETHYVKGYRIRIGLTSGELKLRLGDVEHIGMHPQEKLTIKLKRQLGKEISRSMEIEASGGGSEKGIFLSNKLVRKKNQKQSESFTDEFCRIQTSGDAYGPSWIFLSPARLHLTGHCDNVGVDIPAPFPSTDVGSFLFRTTPADWSCHAQNADKETSLLRRGKTNMAIKRTVKRIMRCRTENFTILSKGTI